MGIEPKTMLKAQKLLILLNAKTLKTPNPPKLGTRRVHGSRGYLTPREFAQLEEPKEAEVMSSGDFGVV
jgi:hypothetical protein